MPRVFRKARSQWGQSSGSEALGRPLFFLTPTVVDDVWPSPCGRETDQAGSVDVNRTLILLAFGWRFLRRQLGHDYLFLLWPTLRVSCSDLLSGRGGESSLLHL